jgi:hypothetical protein
VAEPISTNAPVANAPAATNATGATVGGRRKSRRVPKKHRRGLHGKRAKTQRRH